MQVFSLANSGIVEILEKLLVIIDYRIRSQTGIHRCIKVGLEAGILFRRIVETSLHCVGQSGGIAGCKEVGVVVRS